MFLVFFFDAHALVLHSNFKFFFSTGQLRFLYLDSDRVSSLGKFDRVLNQVNYDLLNASIIEKEVWVFTFEENFKFKFLKLDLTFENWHCGVQNIFDKAMFF